MPAIAHESCGMMPASAACGQRDTPTRKRRSIWNATANICLECVLFEPHLPPPPQAPPSPRPAPCQHGRLPEGSRVHSSVWQGVRAAPCPRSPPTVTLPIDVMPSAARAPRVPAHRPAPRPLRTSSSPRSGRRPCPSRARSTRRDRTGHPRAWAARRAVRP